MSVAFGSTRRIDRDNILRASLWALARAVKALPVRPKLVFVDGNQKIDVECDCQTVVSGDALVLSVAAASIVAKVTRDRLMARLGLEFPGYGFERHMGYSRARAFRGAGAPGPDHPPPQILCAGGGKARRPERGLGDADEEALPRCCLFSPPSLSLRVPLTPAPLAGGIRNGPMHYVSLIIEFLRGRPAVVFWTVALTQAALWTLMPALFYSAPPGDVPMLLAIGHEFVLGSYLGPPLAFWLGEIAFRIAGAFGLYALAQACIVVAYWAVFTLGRDIVGTRHAVLAVLLMVGITAFSVPSPNFGPAMMAAPLWALALLYYWRAVGLGQRGYWFLLALDLGLLMLASYVGLILIVLLVAVHARDRARAARALHPEPWIAVLPLFIVIFPHLAWLEGARGLVIDDFNESGFGRPPQAGEWLCLSLLATHLGLALLVTLASGWPRQPRERAPEIDRNPVERLARALCLFLCAGAGAGGDRRSSL